MLAPISGVDHLRRIRAPSSDLRIGVSSDPAAERMTL